jgi:DNA-binding transcriptional ArsR family regulator
LPEEPEVGTMADLLPSSTSADPDTDPKVVGLDSEDADEMMSALSSGTARAVLSELQDDPGSPSEVADRVDTSLQNAQYHLGNLEDAGVIEVIDTAYSEKGREMDVYAPANEPLVVFAGSEDEAGTLRSALGRLIGGVALLGALSLGVQFLLGGASGGGGDGQMGAMQNTGGGGGGGLPPGLLFFAGGAVVLVAALALWYVVDG